MYLAVFLLLTIIIGFIKFPLAESIPLPHRFTSCKPKPPGCFPRMGRLGESLAPHTVREREATARLSDISTCLCCDPKEAPAGKL